MAMYRAYARLQYVYNECDLTDAKLTAKLGDLYPKAKAGTPDKICFQWKRSIFFYYPKYNVTDYIIRFPSEPASKNRIIEGIRIVETRRKQFPEETAIMVPYVLKGHKLKASILWSDHGKIFAYNHDTNGVVEVNYSAIGDLQHPDKYKALGVAADKAIQSVKKVNIGYIVQQSLNKPDALYDESNFNVENMAAVLETVGVKTAFLPQTKERFPDGTLREYPKPSLTFNWGGANYTYGPDFACVMTSGTVIRD
jgi:hypothetical protein